MSGIRDALEGLACECRPFQNSLMIDIGGPFGEIAIAEEAMQSDAIVNLAKLKTHSQMLLTLAVKNLFGCIIGYRKPEWHMRAGIDRQAFARLLERIGRTLRPAFNILDGILAMEGQGPGRGGIPKELGVLMAGSDPFAVDLAVCRMLDLDPGRVPILQAAAETGDPLIEPDIDGTLPEIRGFHLPRLNSPIFGPRFLHGFIRRQLLQRPVCNGDFCQMCGECNKICPAGAITSKESALHFDYDRCMRCYCCIEICPFGALRSAETRAGRLVRRAAAVILPPGSTR
jgi:ferredoxin